MTRKESGSSTRSTFSLFILALCLLGSFVLPSFNLSRSQAHAAGGGQTKFQRISTQFIAALGDPGATSGSGAQSWGLWPLDPGPRGVELNSYQRLKDPGAVAAPHRTVKATDWSREEQGYTTEERNGAIAPRKHMG